MGDAKRRKMVQVGRLAIRQEGDMWNAYYAPADTMKDAILLGSIRLTLIVRNDQRKQAFMDLMRDSVGELIHKGVGIEPTWGGPQPAPESERSGNA